MWLKMLWSLVARFLPGLKSPWLLAVVAAAAFAAGAWTAYRVVQGGEVRALEQTIADQAAAHRSSLASVESFYKGELARAKASVKIQEVVKYVPNDTVCRIPAEPVGVLDTARQGVPEPAASAAGGTRESAPPVGISQRQLYRADADLADRFQSCRQQVQELKRWYESTRSR